MRDTYSYGLGTGLHIRGTKIAFISTARVGEELRQGERV